MNSPKGQNQGVGSTDTHHAKRPLSDARGFSELIGQADCIRRLKAFGDLYASKNTVPEHILLTGADGMGKGTIARAFAKTYSAGLCEHPAKEFYKLGDLSAVITSMEPNDALIITDVQDLRRNMTDVLRMAIQEFRIDLIIGVGPGARVHPYRTNQFTLIATSGRRPTNWGSAKMKRSVVARNASTSSSSNNSTHSWIAKATGS